MLTTITAECSAPARSSSPTDWCLLRKRAHHLNTLERDKVSFLNTANRRQWISAPETPSVIRNLYLCVAPAERQRPLFILHVNNDVISDVTREHNVIKIHVICYSLVLMLVFYCNFLHENIYCPGTYWTSLVLAVLGGPGSETRGMSGRDDILLDTLFQKKIECYVKTDKKSWQGARAEVYCWYLLVDTDCMRVWWQGRQSPLSVVLVQKRTGRVAQWG